MLSPWRWGDGGQLGQGDVHDPVPAAGSEHRSQAGSPRGVTLGLARRPQGCSPRRTPSLPSSPGPAPEGGEAMPAAPAEPSLAALDFGSLEDSPSHVLSWPHFQSFPHAQEHVLSRLGLGRNPPPYLNQTERV